MSAAFTAASSQYLENASPPVVTIPLTVGGWLRQNNTTSGKSIWSLMDGTSATSNGYGVVIGLSCAMVLYNAGTSNNLSISGNTANAWHFFVARWVTTTNRQMAVLQPDGSFNTQSSVTSLTPGVTPNKMRIGARALLTPDNFFEGAIGELWWTNTDIQPDGGVINEALFRQLAYCGPFSVPHIAKDIVDYRSLRSLGSDQDDIFDYYMGNKGRQVWTNVNGTTLGPDVPVSSLYVRPNDPNLLTPRWFRAYPDAGAGVGASTKFQSYFIG